MLLFSRKEVDIANKVVCCFSLLTLISYLQLVPLSASGLVLARDPIKDPLLQTHKYLPFSTFTSDAGIKAVPSRLSAVIASKPTVDVVPSISPPYIPSTLDSERMYGTTSSGFQNRSKSFGHTIV